MKILKFYTQTCMTCKIVGKILDKMGLNVEPVDANENIGLVDEYEVCTTPTLIFLNEENKEVGRITGITTQSKIQEVIDNLK